MSIQVHCSCGQDLSVPEKYSGRRLACPTCGKKLAIGGGPAAAPQSAKVSGHVRTTCKCGKTLTAKATLAGRNVKCPACGEQVALPGAPTEPHRLIVFRCKCGRKLRAPANWVGKKTKCPTCQLSVAVPAEPAAADSPPSNANADLSGLLDEIGAHECKTSRRCPNCKKDMERDDVLCIECGYNVRTGKLIETNEAHRKSMLEVMRGWLGES